MLDNRPADQVSSVRDEADQEEKREAVLFAVYELLKELESRRAIPARAPSE
jgi:hypothetical protein